MRFILSAYGLIFFTVYPVDASAQIASRISSSIQDLKSQEIIFGDMVEVN